MVSTESVVLFDPDLVDLKTVFDIQQNTKLSVSDLELKDVPFVAYTCDNTSVKVQQFVALKNDSFKKVTMWCPSKGHFLLNQNIQ